MKGSSPCRVTLIYQASCFVHFHFPVHFTFWTKTFFIGRTQSDKDTRADTQICKHINPGKCHLQTSSLNWKQKECKNTYMKITITIYIYIYIYILKCLCESEVLQYFGNAKHSSTALNLFAVVVKVMNHTEQWDAELAWYSPSTTCRICRGCEGHEPHWTMRCRARQILSGCYLPDFPSMGWSRALKSTLLGLPDLTRSSRFLQLKRNFLNDPITILRSNSPSPCVSQVVFLLLPRRYGPDRTRKP